MGITVEFLRDQLTTMSKEKENGVTSLLLEQHLPPDDSTFYAVMLRGHVSLQNLIHALGLDSELAISDETFKTMAPGQLYFVRLHQAFAEPWEATVFNGTSFTSPPELDVSSQ